MAKKKPPTFKNAIKKQQFRLKEIRRRNQINHSAERTARMSQTHTGEVTKAAKKVAKWLITRLHGTATLPTTGDVMTHIRAAYQAPKFGAEDQIAIGRAALAFVKRDDPAAWTAWTHQQPDIQDRPAAPPEGGTVTGRTGPNSGHIQEVGN